MIKASKKNKDNKISISAPWGNKNIMQSINSAEVNNPRIQELFIKDRSRVHLEYIKEVEKTKRVYLIISALLLALALLIVFFSPEEKQTVSYWIGASLLVLAAGAAGYKRIWVKSKLLEIKGDQDNEKE